MGPHLVYDCMRTADYVACETQRPKTPPRLHLTGSPPRKALPPWFVEGCRLQVQVGTHASCYYYVHAVSAWHFAIQQRTLHVICLASQHLRYTTVVSVLHNPSWTTLSGPRARSTLQ